MHAITPRINNKNACQWVRYIEDNIKDAHFNLKCLNYTTIFARCRSINPFLRCGIVNTIPWQSWDQKPIIPIIKSNFRSITKLYITGNICNNPLLVVARTGWISTIVKIQEQTTLKVNHLSIGWGEYYARCRDIVRHLIVIIKSEVCIEYMKITVLINLHSLLF